MDDRCVAAGVLPIAVHQGIPYLLLGQEISRTGKSSDGTWCGFGGSRDSDERVVETAIREFMEESMALIMNEEEIGGILNYNQDGRLLARYQYDRPQTYIEHLVLISYDETLPSLFERVYRQFNLCATVLGRSCQLEQCNIIGVDIGKTCLPMFEKRKIAWIPLEKVFELCYRTSSIESDIVLRPEFAESLNGARDVVRKALQPWIT